MISMIVHIIHPSPVDAFEHGVEGHEKVILLWCVDGEE